MRRESSNPAAVNRKKQRTLAPSGTSKSLPFEEASAITGKPTSIVVGGSAAVSAPHTPGTPLPRSGVVVGPSPMAAGTAAAAAAAAAATTTTTAATAAAVPATPTAAAAASAARSRPRTPRATSSPPRPGALHKATAAGTQSVADLFATAQQQRLKPPTPTRPVHAPSSAAVPPAAATGAAAPATPASSGVFGSSPMSAGRAPSIPGAGAGAGAAGATAAAEIPKLQQTIAELRAALSLARTAEGKARAEAASVKVKMCPLPFFFLCFFSLPRSHSPLNAAPWSVSHLRTTKPATSKPRRWHWKSPCAPSLTRTWWPRASSWQTKNSGWAALFCSGA